MNVSENSTWLIQPISPNGHHEQAFRFTGVLPMMLRFRSALIYDLVADARRKSANDDTAISIENYNIESVPLVDVAWMQARGYAPAILTKAQAVERASHGGRYTVVSSMEDNAFFFTNDHCYGLNRVAGPLPGGWVSCSFGLPTQVVSRPGLEDGLVDTIDKWIFVFERDGTLIESESELTKFL